MKKIQFLFTFLLLALVGCNNEEWADEVPVKNQANVCRWYGVQRVASPQTRGVTDGAKTWSQNAPIKVKFLNSPSNPVILTKVKQYAKEWEEFANIRFEFVGIDDNAFVRIGFDWDGNDYLTWSYTGNDARLVTDNNQPTAVFGGLDYWTEEEDLRADVLRVFGQILGLEYEQRHSGWDETWWKKDRDGRYYAEYHWEEMFEGYDFDWETIRKYVFDPLSSENSLYPIETQELDEESIMMWPNYSRKETNKLYVNTELSEQDKIFIAQLYPESNLPTIQEAWLDTGLMEWRTRENTPPHMWSEGMVSLCFTVKGMNAETLPDVRDGEQLTSCIAMFGRINTSHEGDPKLKRAPKFKISPNVNNFGSMFYRCSRLEEIPKYDTSNGRHFANMFYQCRSLKSIPPLDVSNGVNFSYMFQGVGLQVCPPLNTSKGKDFEGMFRDANFLREIPRLDISNGAEFVFMFHGNTPTRYLEYVELVGLGNNPECEAVKPPLGRVIWINSPRLKVETIIFLVKNSNYQGEEPFQIIVPSFLAIPQEIKDEAASKNLQIVYRYYT